MAQVSAALRGVAFKLGQVRDRADEGVLSFRAISPAWGVPGDQPVRADGIDGFPTSAWIFGRIPGCLPAGTAVGAGVSRGSSKRRGRIVLAGDAAGALRPYGLSHGCDQVRGPDQEVWVGRRGERA